MSALFRLHSTPAVPIVPTARTAGPMVPAHVAADRANIVLDTITELIAEGKVRTERIQGQTVVSLDDVDRLADDLRETISEATQ
jgi:hypothetical protein